MRLRTICTCLAGLTGLLACTQALQRPEPPLLAYFQPTPAPDTLRFEVSQDDEQAPPGDTIPNALFFTAVPRNFLQEIEYVADSVHAFVLGRRRFPLDDSTDACWVDIRQFWFQHQSLLVYDKRRQTFSGRVTVAEWYGGDGGQALTGSWMLDFDGDGDRDLVWREIQHSMRPEGDSMREDFYESAMLLAWKSGRFVEQPLSDTALMVKQFPIRWMW